MRQDAIMLFENAPEHDFFEMLLEILTLTIIVVAQDETFVTIQRTNVLPTLTEINVTQMVNDIMWLDRLVPVFEQQRIHLFDGCKLSDLITIDILEIQEVGVTEMRIGDDEDVSQCSLPQTLKRFMQQEVYKTLPVGHSQELWFSRRWLVR